MNINFVNKALAIFNKEANQNLTLESFKEKLKQIFVENKHLSKSQIKTKMLEYIKTEQPFGEKAAEAADYLVVNQIPEYVSKQKVLEYSLESHQQVAPSSSSNERSVARSSSSNEQSVARSSPSDEQSVTYSRSDSKSTSGVALLEK